MFINRRRLELILTNSPDEGFTGTWMFEFGDFPPALIGASLVLGFWCLVLPQRLRCGRLSF
jgi:hypothetical protein